MSGAGRLLSIQVSPGGVPKLAVAEAFVGRLGLAGDRHAHPAIHGGPERAVCLFSAEVIDLLRAEGHPIAPGTTGENLTVAGLDWASVAPGRVLRVGAAGVVLEVTSYTKPCKSIRPSFRDFDSRRISQEAHAGESRVYARVLREGVVRAGDAVALEP